MFNEFKFNVIELFSILNFLYSTLNEFFNCKSSQRGNVYQMFENFIFQNVKYLKHLKESMKSA